MQVIRHGEDPVHRYVRRQQPVEAFLGRRFDIEIEMREHLHGMYAGIRPTGKGQRHRLPQDRGKGVLHNALHSHAIRLNLRTVVMGTFIGELDEVTHRFVD